MKSRWSGFDSCIESILLEYDQRKSVRRSVFGDHPAIAALQNLPPEARKDYYKIFMCFDGMIPEINKASREVFEVIIATIKENFIIESDEAPIHFVYVLHHLVKKRMLTRKNFNKVMSLNNHDHLNATLNMLYQQHLLRSDNLQYILDHVHKDNFVIMVNSLWDLNRAKLLKQGNFSIVMGYIANKKGDNICLALKSLVIANILTQNNLNRILPLANISRGVPAVLYHMRLNNILTQENFDNYTSCLDIKSTSYLICKLSNTFLLNQQNLNLIFDPTNSFLITGIAKQFIWCIIRDEALTQDIFEILFENCAQLNELRLLENGEFAIRAFLLRQIFREYDDQHVATQNNAINYSQSIHNANVERTVSESAVKLHHRYAEKIDDETRIVFLDQIFEFISKLPDDTVVNRSAKRCIARVTGEMFTYTEPASGISFLELLILAWIALRDINFVRCEDQSESLQQFVHGLHEIQRGGNLSDLGVDPGDLTDHPEINANDKRAVKKYTDKPICAGGTFNKIVEKLAGMHPDCQIIFISMDTMTLKMQVIVTEEVKTYLRSLYDPKPIISEILREGSIESIWDKIRDSIMERMYSEFGSQFAGRESGAFIEFVDAVKDSAANWLEDFYPSTQSTGTLSHSTLFSNDQKTREQTQHSNGIDNKRI